MTIASTDTVTPGELSDLARRLALESPRLADLTPGQLEHLAEVVILANLRDDLKRLVGLSKIDLSAEMRSFLATASRTDSWKTLEAYAYGLAILERWTDRKGLPFLELTPRLADEFIYTLRAEGRAPASIRLIVAAASSFFSYLERRFDAARNPFRGTRARPAARPVRPLVIPTSQELERLLQAAPPDLNAALTFMSGRGFRVGALPTIVIDQTRFSGRSKGKDIAGFLPEPLLACVGLAGLDRRKPFGRFTGEQLSVRVLRLSGRLFRRGLIRHPFSAHDLRHYFAVATYTADPDLYRLKILLGHSSVATTERYLRSLASPRPV